MEYKYCLIVSQYYHSRHMFIVEIDGNFIEKAREFALELMKYKRSDDENRTREEYLGDLDPKYSNGELRSRYNINDAGDIYFINSPYANYCMSVACDYTRDSLRESKGYIKKAITEEIDNHHSYKKVKEVVQNHFEII